MYNFFALLSGVIVAFMVVLNGDLTAAYGNYNATFIIRSVGVLFSFIFVKLRGNKIVPQEKLPLRYYFIGALGILNTLFSNFSFGKISLTSILALTLFGQTVFSLIIDSFGLFGMEKHPMAKTSLTGMIFSLIGIALMLEDVSGVDTAAVTAIFLSFASGLIMVLSRTLNAKLSEHVGAMSGSFINQLSGLPFTLLLALVMPGNNINLLGQRPQPPIWIYFGGLFAVLVVYLMNIVVPEISSFRLTLLSFVGQVFLGVLLDLIRENDFSPRIFYGGLIVASGVGISMLADYAHNMRNKLQRVKNERR